MDPDREFRQSPEFLLLFLEAVVNSSADGVLVVDPLGQKIFQNRRTTELWKIAPEVAADPDGSRQVAHVMRMTKNPQQFLDEIEHQKKFPLDVNVDQLELIDGTVLDRHSAPVVGKDGTLYGRIYHFHDVTGFRQAQEKISGLLREKESLLKEVHHRVKNYMAGLSGLLTMQTYTMTDSAAINALEDAQSRIQNMMYLYDKLYVKNEANSMSLAVYLPGLVEEILQNFPKKAEVTVENDIDDVVLDPKRLQVLGVITNELFTNIMKYAFVGRTTGRVFLSVKRLGGKMQFSVADDGIGLRSVDGTESRSGFGLTLVADLAAQLKGMVHIDGHDGTKVTIILDVAAQPRGSETTEGNSPPH